MRIEPFRPPLVFRDIGSAVTSPPFDTISPEQERQLKSNPPHNISHLTLPGPDGPGSLRGS
ncbi:DUF1015 family protein [Thermogymnomonas acidicola]|uniref:DUF1015 family protein n=1 Tax=Thermogymnomonas acidicola TaxID=399579 RepID=UPI00094648B0|nr:DUF1015 family protein [Thermogymnomonas acidicola]